MYRIENDDDDMIDILSFGKDCSYFHSEKIVSILFKNCSYLVYVTPCWLFTSIHIIACIVLYCRLSQGQGQRFASDSNLPDVQMGKRVQLTVSSVLS